jgi:hypothetical protein
MKKRYILFIIILIIILSTFFVMFHKSKIMGEDVKLRNHIIKTLGQSDGIDFTNITDFSWDVMFIFPPYSIPIDTFKLNGIKNNNSNYSIEYRDDINMIAFVKLDKVVSFIELSRNYGFKDITKCIKFKRDDAHFKISQQSRRIIFNKK